MHKVLLVKNCPYTLTDKLDVRSIDSMEVLIPFTKFTKIILLNKLNYYRLLSISFNNRYKYKHKLKRIHYS